MGGNLCFGEKSGGVHQHMFSSPALIMTRGRTRNVLFDRLSQALAKLKSPPPFQRLNPKFRKFDTNESFPIKVSYLICII